MVSSSYLKASGWVCFVGLFFFYGTVKYSQTQRSEPEDEYRWTVQTVNGSFLPDVQYSQAPFPNKTTCLSHRKALRGSLQRKCLYAVPKYNLVYCQVPKVASTSIKIILCLLSRNNGNCRDEIHLVNRNLMVRSTFDAEMFHSRYSVMFSRNPWTRLVSGFIQKFQLTDEGYSFCATPRKPEISFPQFLTRCVVRQFESGVKRMNSHWQPAYSLCSMCTVDYSFVGKMENFDDDIMTVLNTIGAPRVAKLMNITEKRMRSNEKAGSTQRAYDSIWKLVPFKTIQKLQFIYKLDIELFGYPYWPLP